MTLREDVSDIGNVNYTFSDDGIIGYGHLSDGTIFMFDADLFSRIKDIKWYVSYKSRKGRQIYIVDCHGRPLHQVLFSTRKGMELDHINLDTLDNRRCNVRFCTHQQNQINQPLQKNNTSGVSGVSYYPPRKKYRARIKISQLDIHLGYYDTFQEAVQARNKVTDYSLGIFGTSDNFIMAMQMAKALSSSTIVPATFQRNDANCLIAIEQANRLKVSPLMVMQNLYVIQGRPSWSSKFLIAAINNSGKFDMELQFEETKGKDGKPFSCMAWTMKNGRRVEGMTVDMDMAKDEGWLSKNGSKWKTMPQLMLRYRAASFFSSLNCPELTMGLYTKEEMQDNDFKEYPVEEMQMQAQKEIAANANMVDFEPEEPETVTEPDGQQAMPDFMK